MLMKPCRLRKTHMFKEFQCQMLVPNKKNILLIYLLNHILRRRQKWAKQYFAWQYVSSRVTTVWNNLLSLRMLSEKSRSFIIRIWINKNLYHVWHFKWVSYNFPSLKPLPQSVQRSLYWPVWTDKWYFKFISLVYDLSQYSHLYFLPSCPLMCILKLVVSLIPFLQMWQWKRKCPVCSCSCLFKLDIAVNCLSHFSHRKFRRRFREDNFRPFSFDFSSKNPW